MTELPTPDKLNTILDLSGETSVSYQVLQLYYMAFKDRERLIRQNEILEARIKRLKRELENVTSETSR